MAEDAGIYFEDHKESRDLGRLSLRGGAASVAMQYCNGALQLAAAVVLARLLGPEDFGLVALVTVVTSFVPFLVDFGLGDAATQRIKINPSQVSSLFWFSTGIGLAIAIVVAACSPLIAWIYREPRLEPIAMCSAITFVLYGVTNLHQSLLRRTMQFGRIAKIQILSSLVGVAIAIFIAICGYGYWALVLRPIATSLCVAIGTWFVCRWRPGVPVFDREVRSMLKFGINVVGFSITYSLARALDRIGLGLFYRPVEVGYYQNAMTLYDNSIFSALAQLHTVGSAALSKLQSNPAALRQRYEAALSTLAFFFMPMAAILSVIAQELTVMLLGQKWRLTGFLLSIIALRGIFQVVEGSQGWLHLAIGRPDRWRNWGMVTAIVQIVAVLGGLPFGSTGVAGATVIASVLIAVPAINYAGRPIDIGAPLVFRAVYRQLIGSIAILIGGSWMRTAAFTDFSNFFRISLLTVFCVAIYLFFVVGLFRLTQPITVAGTVVWDLWRNR